MSALAPPRYRVVLPPGFLLFPVRARSDAEIAAIVREHYRDLPRDTYGPRIDRTVAQVVASARAARDAGVLDLIVPMGVPWRAPVSFAIALSVTAEQGGTASWGELEGERVRTDAGEAVRTLDRFPPPPESDELGPLARIRCAWRMPQDERMLVGVCTVSGSADPELAPVVEGLIELGDLMLQTIRWAE